jgi:peptidoglycan/xylan/chitin deacetylase (PgdA/CDA1 family)
VEHTITAPDSPGPNASRLGRGPRWLGHGRVLWWLATFAVALLLVGTIAGVTWGRAHLTWNLRPSDNQLTITLAPGQGPFASWLVSHSTLAAGNQSGRQITFTLPAGQTSRLKVVVTSVWSTTVSLDVQVPPQPSLLNTSVDAQTMTLYFSMPVTPRNVPCGLAEGAFEVTTLTFARGTTSCSGALDVVATSGEQAEVPFSIPAIPPPPPPLPPLPAPRALGPAPVIYFGPADGGAFYITIDDGKSPDPDVLALMQSAHIPITAFLTNIWAAPHLDYWKSFQAAGGDIEDHTVSHPDLTTLSEAADRAQWVGAAQACRTWFRKSPTLGRPPFGTFNRNVQIAAGQAGLRYVVLWSASMYNGKLTTYDHGPLRAGEIVILHWVPGVYNSLVRLLQIASAQGLHPASLLASLG